MCSERAWKMITTKRLFVYGAGALILSLPCMLIGSMLGYRNVLYHSWLGFSAYIVFAVLISFIAISRRYSRDERRLVFLCLLFGLWYVVTSVFVDQTMLALMVPLYMIGLAIAIISLRCALAVAESTRIVVDKQ